MGGINWSCFSHGSSPHSASNLWTSQLSLVFAGVWATGCWDGKGRWLGHRVGGLLSPGDNYMLRKGQPWLVLGNRGELLSTFWKAGAMLERGWREPLMGLAAKQLFMRRISVIPEVSHARISTTVLTSRMSRARMTYLVRKGPLFKGRTLRELSRGLGWEVVGALFAWLIKNSPKSMFSWVAHFLSCLQGFHVPIVGGALLAGLLDYVCHSPASGLCAAFISSTAAKGVFPAELQLQVLQTLGLS